MKLQYNDPQHAYWLDGKRCKSVTTVAKIPEDTFRLEQWSQRQVAIGLAVKPSLLEQISANVENNSKINEICEKAAAEAGAHEGRDRGNALHQALEAHDLNKRFIPTDLTSAAIVGWETICEAMGWTVELVERCVVWPEQLIAGRFDRIVRDKEGAAFVVDFKGGAKVTSYPHAIACQLALYACAPKLAGPIPGDGGFTEQFEHMPTLLNHKRAYVVHLPPDSDAQLIEINIGAAADVIHSVIFPTIKWRAAKGLAKIVELPTRLSDHSVDVILGSDNPFLDALAVSKEAYIENDPFAGLPNETNAPVLNKAPKPLIDLTNRQWNIADRLKFLKEEHPEMAQIVAGRWPEGVPNIKIPLTAEDLDRIEAVLIDAERAVEAPFDPLSVPGEQQLPPAAAVTPAPGTIDYPIGKYVEITWFEAGEVNSEQSAAGVLIAIERDTAILDWGFGVSLGAKDFRIVESTRRPDPDEGPDMAPADIAAFKATFADLDAEQQTRIDAWAAQAHAAGVSISMRDKPSKRRFSIGRFLLIASHHHEDVVRAVLSLALGDEIQTSVTTGSVLGVLTQQEAEKAWEILLSIDGSSPAYHVIRDNGEVRLVAA